MKIRFLSVLKKLLKKIFLKVYKYLKSLVIQLFYYFGQLLDLLFIPIAIFYQKKGLWFLEVKTSSFTTFSDITIASSKL